MANRAEWMIYGANGYTGRLVAAEAKRQGLNPVLAGRRARPTEKLATELGLPARVFDVDDPPSAIADGGSSTSKTLAGRPSSVANFSVGRARRPASTGFKPCRLASAATRRPV